MMCLNPGDTFNHVVRQTDALKALGGLTRLKRELPGMS
jgi:hypothetical protein